MKKLGLILAVLVLAADQASKAWVLYGLHLEDVGSIAVMPLLNFTMVWNHGVTFGLLNGLGSVGPIVLAGIAVAVVIALYLWLRRTDSAMVAVALGGIAGGAIGNVIDRLRFGAVVDFLHAHAFGYSWYVFNVADAAIVGGVGLLLLDSLKQPRLQPPAGGAKERS